MKINQKTDGLFIFIYSFISWGEGRGRRVMRDLLLAQEYFVGNYLWLHVHLPVNFPLSGSLTTWGVFVIWIGYMVCATVKGMVFKQFGCQIVYSFQRVLVQNQTSFTNVRKLIRSMKNLE